MPAPPLQHVQAAARQLLEALPAHAVGTDALWQLEGVETAGKSSCLRLLADLLSEGTELKPILVAPPAHDLDTGPAALADVAVGLAGHGLLNGQLDAWREGGASWNERVDLVRRCIAANDDVVLLFDEPSAWGANRGGDDFFAKRSFDAAFSLMALSCRRVVTGEMPFPLRPLDRIELEPAGTDTSWLGGAGWGELQAAAHQVADGPMSERPLTPLQLRILVAATSLGSAQSVAEWVEHDGDGRRITSGFAEMLAGDSRYRRLWDAWLSLSTTRRAFDEQLLDEITPGGMTSLERDIVANCLVFGDSELRLHDTLRAQAAKWRVEHRHDDRVRKLIARVNRKLFEIHQRRFGELATKRDARALIESMEAFHFASATGDSKLIAQAAPVFVEQLDALGWSLSYEHKEYQRAVKAFEQALKWDDTDDYAHHYLAYNLDRLAKRVKDVERHFRRAVELNGKHPWWRARLIIFLVSRGRREEALHAWEDAVIGLGVDEGDASLEIYERLHCWVSDALLDAGEPRLAREILDAVPVWARSQLDAYASLDQRTDALLQAGDQDPVVPAWRLRPGWWQDGPELLQHRLGTGEQLVRWLAARVESKDTDAINIRGSALEPDQDSDPSIAWSQISFESFDGMCRDNVTARDLSVGSFIEIGIYATEARQGKHAETIIRVLPPEQEWSHRSFPSPDPLRYVDSGSAGRTPKQHVS